MIIMDIGIFLGILIIIFFIFQAIYRGRWGGRKPPKYGR